MCQHTNIKRRVVIICPGIWKQKCDDALHKIYFIPVKTIFNMNPVMALGITIQIKFASIQESQFNFGFFITADLIKVYNDKGISDKCGLWTVWLQNIPFNLRTWNNQWDRTSFLAWHHCEKVPSYLRYLWLKTQVIFFSYGIWYEKPFALCNQPAQYDFYF